MEKTDGGSEVTRELAVKLSLAYRNAVLAMRKHNYREGYAHVQIARRYSLELRDTKQSSVSEIDHAYVDLLYATLLSRIGNATEAIPVLIECRSAIQKADVRLMNTTSRLCALSVNQSLVSCLIVTGEFAEVREPCRDMLELAELIAATGENSDEGFACYVGGLLSAVSASLVVPELRERTLTSISTANDEFLSSIFVGSGIQFCKTKISLVRGHARLLVAMGDVVGALDVLRQAVPLINRNEKTLADSEYHRQAALLLCLYASVSYQKGYVQNAINSGYRALNHAVLCRRTGEGVLPVEITVINQLCYMLGASVLDRIGWDPKMRSRDIEIAISSALRHNVIESQDILIGLGQCALEIEPRLAEKIYQCVILLSEKHVLWSQYRALSAIRVKAEVGLAEAFARQGRVGNASVVASSTLRRLSVHMESFIDDRVFVAVNMVRCAQMIQIGGNYESALRVIEDSIRLLAESSSESGGPIMRSGIDAVIALELTSGEPNRGRRAVGMAQQLLAERREQLLCGLVDRSGVDTSMIVNQRLRLVRALLANEHMSGVFAREIQEVSTIIRSSRISANNPWVGDEMALSCGDVGLVSARIAEAPDNLKTFRSAKSSVFVDILWVGNLSTLRNVNIAVVRDRYVSTVLTPDGEVSLIELGESEEIDRLVRQWRWEIQSGADDETTARRLRELVWAPVEQRLGPEITRVYICPDGELTALPWAALPGTEPGEVVLDRFSVAVVPYASMVSDVRSTKDRRGRNTQDLPSPSKNRSTTKGAQLPISKRAGGDGAALSDQVFGARIATDQVSVSADSVLLDRSSALLEGGWLIVGDVDYDNPKHGRLRHVVQTGTKIGWEPLPHSRDELETLGHYVPPGRRIELSGPEASRRRVLEELPRARWAHLATHGFVADSNQLTMVGLDNPDWRDVDRRRQEIILRRHPLLLSGLVLAGGNHVVPPAMPSTPGADRPILSGEDVAGLSLDQLELVVLSSCESGMGELMLGEGIFGLQRAFHLAGAKNVVASLWQVDDQATAALMKWFYFFLFEEQLDPLDALRHAQLTIRRQGPTAPALANSRGPNFRREARQLATQSSHGPARHAPTRLWAGFLLSGTGE